MEKGESEKDSRHSQISYRIDCSGASSICVTICILFWSQKQQELVYLAMAENSLDEHHKNQPVSNGYRKILHLLENLLISGVASFPECYLQEVTLHGDYMEDINIVALNTLIYGIQKSTISFACILQY